MDLHNLRAAPGARKDRRRLGRGHGSGRGKTAGRGTKGQKSRAGKHIRPGFEGGALPLIMRMPFKRGINFFNPNAAARDFECINVRQLAGFEPGSVVSPETLAEARLISSAKCRVKILGDGELDRALTVRAHAFSASAKAKVEQSGGTAEVIGKTEPEAAKE
jgi:large subunit ribosomal protein L15